MTRDLVGEEAVRGLELALTPVVFGGLGWLLDRWLGTDPWLAVGFATFAVVGTVAKLWYAYDAEMRDLEANSRWARRREPTAPDVAIDLWADRKASGT